MEKTSAWRRLDNAAKFFPPVSTRRNPYVFRIACELVEMVDAGCLQAALDDTLQRLPYFRSSLKKGIFWYYLEEADTDIKVQPDKLPPCSIIYQGDSEEPLFRLTYYRHRINLEVYHALADGTGALVFMRSLVQCYLAKKHGEISGETFLDDDGIPQAIYQQDDFEANYSPKHRRHGVYKESAYRVKGDLLPHHGLNFTVGRLPLQMVLAAAKENNATLSEYLVALLIASVGGTMPRRKRQKPVVVSVPVDLRRFYASHTIRNFFANFSASHCFERSGDDFEDILHSVQVCFKNRLDPEALDRQMNQFASLEHNPIAKVVPLFIKSLVLGVSGVVTQGGDSAGFSNLGVVRMPEAAAKYIRVFDVMLSATRPQICLCSFGDTLSIGFSSPLAGTGVQCAFFRSLSKQGIPVDIYPSRESSIKKL